MNGYLGSLSSAQEEALRKLRDLVSDIPDHPENDDHYYLRWLRARSFNVEKAEKMIRNHIVFRREMGCDTILEDWTPPEVLIKCFPGGFFGEDREGSPVWYDNMGNLDFKGLYRSAKKEDLFKLKICHLETTMKICKEQSAKHGKNIENVTSIINLENLSYRRHYHWPSITIFRELLAMFEANYPERTKRIIVVNAPKVFPMAYGFIKPFMDEHTREKIVVLGGSWQEDIQKYISPDQLPQAFGGTRCEPDAWCTDHINPGCDVPSEYFMTNLTETDKEDMERVVVRRGGACELEYQVSTPGSTLRWEFVSTDYDINFGWYIRSKQIRRTSLRPDLKEVIPSQRARSHIEPESGAYQCDVEGTYVLKFDNSYSWTRSKEVFYSVEVKPPNLQQAGSSSDPDPEDSDEDNFYDCADDETRTTA